MNLKVLIEDENMETFMKHATMKVLFFNSILAQLAS